MEDVLSCVFHILLINIFTFISKNSPCPPLILSPVAINRHLGRREQPNNGYIQLAPVPLH